MESRYARSQHDFERNAVLAVSSVYGIDILKDNVIGCRERLFKVFDTAYTARFKKRAKEPCRQAVRFILEQNILRGDAQPIDFSEWSPLNGSLLKRRVFAFHQLLPKSKANAHTLFAAPQLLSDLGEDVFIPEPVREYPVTHFLKVANANS